jgi:hypothetical protein
MATSISVAKSGGNFVVTVTIPVVDITIEGRDNIRKEIMASVQVAAAKAHTGIQRSDAELDADTAKATAAAAELKAARASFTGV